MKKIRKIIFLIIAILVLIIFMVKNFKKDKLESIQTSEIRESYNSEQIISDQIVIPDKYNTGIMSEVEELEKVPVATNWIEPNTQTLFKWTGTNYQVDTTKDCGNNISLENKYFEYSIVFINQSKVEDKKIYTFKNCKFRNIRTEFFSSENVTFKFENCSFTGFAGSDAIFDKCYFGGTTSDGMNPFQNVRVTNSFFSDFSKSTTTSATSKIHSDGVQMYGDSKNLKDVKDIYFYNCRVEIPGFLFTQTDGAVNAAIMIQPEYGDLYNVEFQKCIVNGGGYTIYINSKNQKKIHDLKMNDIKVGCARWYGVLYPSTSVPQSDYEKNNIIYNKVEDNENLYVGSVWKEDNDVHLSVTNDTNSEKTLRVELSSGEVKQFKIKACPSGKTWWNNGGAVQESYDKYTYEDMPFDIDISVGNAQWIKCYDGNELIRTQSFENEQEPDPDVKPITATVSYSTTQITNKDVTATINVNKPVQAVEGWTLSEDKMTLTKTYAENTATNGENVVIKDLVGNTTTVNVKVTNIDKVAPTTNVVYSITELTNQNVVVVIKASERIQKVDGWNLLEDNLTLTKIYRENTLADGENVTVKDLAGNETVVNIKINNIDKIAPVVTGMTSATEATSKYVTIQIIANEQLQKVDGWDLSSDRLRLVKTYTKNTTEDGENIIIKDLAGNSTVVNVKVTSIDESEPTFKLNKYKIKNNYIIKIKPNTDYNTFIKDISTNRDYEVKDGNRTLSGTDMIKTGQKLTNELGQTYTLVVTGDLNGDGKISLVELARISKIGAGKITSMTEIEKMVIDVNGDGKINIIDMAAISKEYKAQK